MSAQAAALGEDDPRALASLVALARLQARQNETDAALETLARAVDNGLRDEAVLANPDLASLQKAPAFEELASRIRAGPARD